MLCSNSKFMIPYRFYSTSAISRLFSKTTKSSANDIMDKEIKVNAIDRSYAAKTLNACLPNGENRHKGQAGRIGIIGGSLEYTGAPYYAGISALRAGADLVHIFCNSSAAIPIKCYSPELIVHPLLDKTDALPQITPWLDRLHTIVIGPGLGREAVTFKVVSDLIGAIKERKIPLVIDADALFLITENLDLVKDFSSPIVLTPNKIEFQRLLEKTGGLSGLTALGSNVTVLKKGLEDEVISCHEIQWRSGEGGSTRRCGGQGDVLSGLIATYLFWTTLHQDKLNTNMDKAAMAASVACYAACAIVRMCNEKAYSKKGLGMLTSDMIEYIHESFEEFTSMEN